MSSATGERPRLLFISPTFPDTQGNGLAMRAGAFLKALARNHDVVLLVVPLFGQPTPTSEALTQGTCARVVVPPLQHGLLARLGQYMRRRPRLVRWTSMQTTVCKEALAGERFDVVHVFRLYCGRLGLSLAAGLDQEPRPQLHLDLDDINALASARLARLHESNGEWSEAQSAEADARAYDKEQRLLLPRFDRVYATSRQDLEQVAPLIRCEARVAPNTIRLPERPAEPITTHPFRFLFVGTLDYYPNEDAVRYFCREVLPRLRARAKQPFHVRIVGRGMIDGLQALASVKEVRLVGEVDDLSREYGDANGVIVPIRSGGGTRIKVLEAFAYRRPVVATSLGVEGIDIVPHQHCLVADTPEAFAGQCLRLMRNPELGRRLTTNAYRLVTERYSPEALDRAVSETP